MDIFFDLDGTLLDAKLRVFTLFCDLTGQKELDFEAYWELKKSKLSHAVLLETRWGYSVSEIHQFEKEFLAAIETPKYLDIDQQMPDVTSYLHQWKSEKHRLFIVTARQSRASVDYQINRWNWSGLFEQLLVTEQQQTKEALIRPFLLNPSQALMVGDTGKDINTGKALKISTVAVLSGFLSKASLEAYQPDFILDSVCDLAQTKLLSNLV
jgi:phosphoglycolate phosphatase